MTDLDVFDLDVVVRPFLRGAEVWAPTDDGAALEFVSGSYGQFARFEEVSRRTRFAIGEGLPGAAWAERRPIVMPTEDPRFLRSGAALEAGISCAVAVPVFCGSDLRGVVVFLCGDRDRAGAIEVWGGGGSSELTLVDGYFGTLSGFERVARATSFAKGVGLAGEVWASAMAVVVEDLAHSARFLRSTAAAEAGVTVGLGYPVIAPGAPPHVVTFLSAMGTPIARWIEIWVATQDGSALRFDAGYSCEGADLPARYQDAVVNNPDGPLGRVLSCGVPLVSDYAGLDGSTGLIALPVFRDGRCAAVVALIS